MFVMCSAFDRLDDFKYQKCVPWPLLQDFASKRTLYSHFLFLLIQSLPPTPPPNPILTAPSLYVGLPSSFHPTALTPASDLQRKIVQNPETKQVPFEKRVSAHVNVWRTIFAQLNVLLGKC